MPEGVEVLPASVVCATVKPGTLAPTLYSVVLTGERREALNIYTEPACMFIVAFSSKMRAA